MDNIVVQIGLWVGAITVALNAIIGIALLIPGDQPEKFLKKVVDMLTKISK